MEDPDGGAGTPKRPDGSALARERRFPIDWSCHDDPGRSPRTRSGDDERDWRAHVPGLATCVLPDRSTRSGRAGRRRRGGGETDDPLPVEIVRPAVVVLWAVAGLVLGVRRRHDRLAPIVLLGAILGGAGSLAATMIEHRSLDGAAAFGWDLTLRLTAALLPAAAMHLLFGLADGRLATPIRRRAVVAGYVLGAAVGVAAMAERDRLVIWPNALQWIAALGIGLYAANVRYAKAGAVDRRRMQWVGWGIAVATEAGIVVVALRLLTDWPDHGAAVALAITGLVPLAITLGTLPTMVARVDRLLTHTVAIAGLTGLVVAVYVVVVLGLGRKPIGDERDSVAAVHGGRRPVRAAVPPGTTLAH